MKIRSNRINIWDLEATCWEDKEYQKEHSEIIEIGICQLDLKTLEIIDQEYYLINPKKSDISEFCTNLTNITQDMMDKEGMSLQRASKLIRKRFAPKKYPSGAWGACDIDKMEKDCITQDAVQPFNKDLYYNLGQIYSMFNQEKPNFSLVNAMKKEGIEYDELHRALPDSINTAKILVNMIKRYQSCNED